MKVRLLISFALSALVLTGAVLHAPFALAQTTDDIQAQIEAHNQQISSLEKEIAGYQTQLNTLGSQHQTLQSAINTLDVSRKQTSTQIQVTQNKIEASNLKLQELSGQISQKEYQIELDKRSVAQSIRDMNSADDVSMVEQIFAADSISDAWTTVDANAAISQAFRTNAQMLSGVKQELAGQQEDVSKTKSSLTDLSSQLGTQQKQLDVAKSAKATLLAQTKNQESSYQSLIAQKQAQEKQFESELQSLQTQLTSVGQSSIPTVGKGILAWPFSPTFAQSCLGKASALGNNFCITQYFGNTPFATANPSVYNGMGHDGIDIGMPIGTPVQAALSGVVMGVGNTDVKSPSGQMCYSFGKWVVVKHANGLATLYAHLSDNTVVSTGQAVTTGQVIGYSGMTGYATGPHLHFGVYAVGTPAAPGIQIMSLAKFRGSGGTPCTDAGAILPVAPNNAYLNPMSYL